MNILVIAAHPDDELLGVGGTIAKHVKEGDTVHCIILGEGASSRTKERVETARKDIDALWEEAKAAAQIIGFSSIDFAGLPDNRFDSVNLLEIIKIVEEKIAQIKPEIIYTHHGGDVNIDHQRTFQAVMTACRPCNPLSPKKIYTFETVSGTEWQLEEKKTFKPNTYINIEQFIEQKKKALACYTKEMRELPHPRSLQGIETLATYRALECGLKSVEAFKLIREVQE
jgi:LmbE family N-acetylglucosaminyl deacetylase